MMLHEILVESINLVLLTEGKEKRLDMTARKMIQQTLGLSDEYMNTVATYEDGNPILTMKGSTQTWAELLQRTVLNQYIKPLLEIDHDAYRFEVGASRILYGELGFQRQAEDDRNTQFKRILRTIAKEHIDEFTDNLEYIDEGQVSQPVSFEWLCDRFLNEAKQQDEAEREEVNSAEYEAPNHNYKIVEIHNYEESSQYEKYTNPNSRWCLTYDETHWKNYNPDGSKRIYFVLEDGFEDIPCERTEGFPLDRYGLSMLCIQMDEFGNMTQCTTRWNHDNPKADQAMSPMEVSKLLGGSVYKLCPPFNNDELIEKGIVPFSMVQEMLNQGKINLNVCSYFGHIEKVRFRHKYNLLDKNTNQLLCPNQWFDAFFDFSDGYAQVFLNGKWNLISSEGKIVSPKQWFDNCGGIYDGCARVQLNGKVNIINTDGKLLSPNQWFDYIGLMIQGSYTKVELNGKCNLINTEGQLLSPNQWFDDCLKFKKGYALVKVDTKWNIINTKGQIVSQRKWFDSSEQADEFLKNLKESHQRWHNILMEQLYREIYR